MSYAKDLIHFINDHPFSKLEAALLSYKNVLNIRFTLENLYIFGKGEVLPKR